MKSREQTSVLLSVDYAYHITTSSPGFSDLPTSLVMERTVGAKLLKFNSGAAIKTKVLSKYHPCLPILIHSILSVAFDGKANAYILNLGNI